MLRKDLTCPTMKPKDQYPILELMKDNLGGKNNERICNPKT